MRALARALALAPLARVVVAELGFDAYCEAFGKSYSGEEYSRRRALFEQRAETLAALSARPGATWTAGLNPMTDLSPEELRRHFGYAGRARPAASEEVASAAVQALTTVGDVEGDVDDDDDDLPARVDWRDRRPAVVAPVRHQGLCGSCWAHAAVASIESALAIATGVLTELSPQQLTSCVPNPRRCGGDGGCAGATQQLAFDYVMQHGLAGAWSAPYLSGVSGSSGACATSEAYDADAGITGYRDLPRNDAEALRRAVARQGPVAVSVDASDWFFYAGGIFDHCDKESPVVNHAVVLDGYGEEGGVKYWLIRNSWGTRFGEAGYIRLRRYDDEPCAVDTDPAQGTGCAGGPPNVTVCGECGVLSDSSLPTGAFDPLDRHRRRLSAAPAPGSLLV